jgi:uncharacterized tellurite resistance protein B-like protein
VSDISRFRNLLAMAAVDDRMSEAEMRLLADRAIQWGITNEQFEDALQQVLAGKAELTIPASKSDRHALLKGLIRVMAADGKLTSAERKLFALAAVTMDVSAEEVNALIDSVLAEEEG